MDDCRNLIRHGHHVPVGISEVHLMDRLVNLANNYNFAIECRQTFGEWASNALLHYDLDTYEYHSQKFEFWNDTADFWMEQGRKERIYVLED